jgi:hypothetical protein
MAILPIPDRLYTNTDRLSIPAPISAPDVTGISKRFTMMVCAKHKRKYVLSDSLTWHCPEEPETGKRAYRLQQWYSTQAVLSLGIAPVLFFDEDPDGEMQSHQSYAEVFAVKDHDKRWRMYQTSGVWTANGKSEGMVVLRLHNNIGNIIQIPRDENGLRWLEHGYVWEPIQADAPDDKEGEPRPLPDGTDLNSITAGFTHSAGAISSAFQQIGQILTQRTDPSDFIQTSDLVNNLNTEECSIEDGKWKRNTIAINPRMIQELPPVSIDHKFVVDPSSWQDDEQVERDKQNRDDAMEASLRNKDVVFTPYQARLLGN